MMIGNKVARRGFSLVELLATVMIISVLAGVSVPLYVSSRRTSAARSCHANLAAIAAAESAWSLRHGAFTGQMSDLASAAEGFAEPPRCPLRSAGSGDYLLTLNTDGSVTIACPNAPDHEQAMPGSAGAWSATVTLGKDTGSL